MNSRLKSAACALFAFNLFASAPAQADLYSLRTSGTISNSSGAATIPVGTPFSFELTYNTAAPDLDFQTGAADPTFGLFMNSSAPPAMLFFHYKAGSYEVTLDDPTDFAGFSDVVITFSQVNAIDININAPTLFPQLNGGAVSFHADFNAFSTAPVFTSDGLPTNTALSPASFDQSSVTLIPPNGVVTGSVLTSLTLSAVNQPTIAGDFNNDGRVDAADYVTWRDNAGTTNALPNDNGIGGVVRQVQYDLWRAHFGSGAAAANALSAGGAIPEPGTCMLAIAAATIIWIRRRPN